MKRSKFTDQQIAYALRQAEEGTAVGDVCRKMGVSESTFCAWKKIYGPPPVRKCLFRMDSRSASIYPACYRGDPVPRP